VGASAKERRRAKQPWIKWSILTAACLCVIIVAGMIVVPMMMGGEDILPGKDRETVSFGDLERHYKSMDTVRTESGMIWPAEYRTAMEKHSHIIWSFRNYVTSGMVVQPQNLGDKIGNYLGFEVREVKGAPEKHVIALGIEGIYYAYRCQDGYDDIPATLGELFDQYNLAKVLELDRFAEHQGRDERYYALTDDAYIIEVLASCRDAKLHADSDKWERSEEYLSFTMTSDALGVYKKAMYITKDGYLWTNVFDYAYIYEIGTEAANKIIDYAMTNSVEKPMEPYEYRLAGTLTKIEDGYAYIDDSIMCVDPDAGMVFRVSTDDLRVSRCLVEDLTGIRPGDLVVVTFRGGIDPDDGNLILDARSIEEAYISDGDWYVPE
jgi:hypothetical protein